MDDKAVESPRERILRAAMALLDEQGRDAVSTRAVSAAAGVQAQTIYRQFGDMQGLLDAVVRRGFADYLAEKTAREPMDDPVEELRVGWDRNVDFGMAHQAMYALMYGNPRPGGAWAVAGDVHEALRRTVRRVAGAGRLCMSVDAAAEMVHSAGSGVVLALIAAGADPATASRSVMSIGVRDAVLDAITIGPVEHAPAAHGASTAAARAVALRAVLPDVADRFSRGELCLLEELLDRISLPRAPEPPQ
ncbi:TetR/AcrR family transcriptional regulator [Microbispora sp. RL4-1S]|uniref:TetR/AcrR family transcriptional regulator n=2 Tax=Microbispora oryzae TaxID=2806554 RepID=A0A941AS58_9ACTN|nr:TetR/AcrR family transcriptional regulator [Microbispora oryzae]